MNGLVRFTIEAERDLEGIASYTVEVWGEARRDAYLDVLEEACALLSRKFRRIARELPGRPTMFRFHVERHVIYFREVADGIEIVRILHERMVPSRHL